MQKKEVMRKAWEIARNGQKKFGGKVVEYLAEALRMAWSEAKAPKQVEFGVNHQPSGGREWVAEIVGRHPKYRFERIFLNWSGKKWSSSGKTGTTYFLLEAGKIYEVNEPWHGRYFVTIRDGVVIEIGKEEVEKSIA